MGAASVTESSDMSPVVLDRAKAVSTLIRTPVSGAVCKCFFIYLSSPKVRRGVKRFPLYCTEVFVLYVPPLCLSRMVEVPVSDHGSVIRLAARLASEVQMEAPVNLQGSEGARLGVPMVGASTRIDTC